MQPILYTSLKQEMIMPEPIGHVTDTAFWVAFYRAKETQRQDSLFLDPLAVHLIGKRGPQIARSMPYPKVLEWIMVTRTVAIDRLLLDTLHETLAEGIDTVINLGTGLDTRPYRMDLPASLRWIEVDFPDMIAFKEEKLREFTPKCRLERVAIDLSNRPEANAFFAKVGAETKGAIVITEGVIAYLSNEHAGQLADDLHRIPTFRYWIQDYRNDDARSRPKPLKRKMKNAPFLFSSTDALGFFAKHRWMTKNKILAYDEGLRLGRNLDFGFPWNWLMKLMPKSRIETFRKGLGYALLERAH
jgi:methyltransferase (TIGR00027 family)